MHCLLNTFFKPLLFITGVLAIVTGCDSTISPKDYNDISPFVSNLQISPDSLLFSASDGQKDTTVTFALMVDGFEFEPDSAPYYYLFKDGAFSAFQEGKLNLSSNNANLYEAGFSIETQTFDFEEYSVLVTPGQSTGSNYVQAKIVQLGVAVNAPEILEVNNPESVVIPSSGNSTTVRFTAKVTDIDGQDNIESVFLNFRNPDGSLLSANPFVMLDDGGAESGDLSPADSIFTDTFIIDSSNTPNNRTAIYWAIDKAGLSSDTLETPFNIVEN